MDSQKNICLVTWIDSPNFGTNLQAYALQHYLEVRGYHVRILPTLTLDESCYNRARSMLHNLVFYRLWIYIKKHFSMAAANYYATRYANPAVQSWAKKQLHSIKVSSRLQLRKLVSNTNCFIAGSDQIWNSYESFDPAMYLAFAKDKKRISYASSLGTSCVNPVHSKQIKRWLSEFSHISVRETSTVPVLQKLTSRSDIVSVLDPTFLLSAEEWTNFTRKPSIAINIEVPFILCYLIGNKEKYHEQLLRISNLTRIARVIVVPACENPCFSVPGAIVYGKATPPEFVWLIQHSSLVCTDSFHATALSINLSRPFVEFLRFEDSDTTSQNVRIKDLLHHFGLDSRLYAPFGDEWLRDIDYAKVQATLAEDRRMSSEFLIQSIEG